VFSPANGSTLSAADEQGIFYDCYLFDALRTGYTEDYHQQVAFPYTGGSYGAMGQAQADLWGTAANPLHAATERLGLHFHCIFRDKDMISGVIAGQQQVPCQ